ncbi:MAG: transcriptional repressor LexA [Alphaproteobacteria bacterium GM7ARS4]|nr:transcriptional repressor LexA [Alphaproteobacteria bacterium GM7ARS4]
MLTKQQRKLLLLIHHVSQERGVGPSYDEMCDCMCLRSKSGIHRLLNCLEERGYIKRLKNRARAVEVIKLPSCERQHDGGRADGEAHDAMRPSFASDTTINFYGNIAAGDPFTAMVQDHETFDVASFLIGRDRENYFALRVSGDSMIGEGIHEGDIAIIKRDAQPRNGSIVAAYIRDNHRIDGEVTLKRLRRRGNSVALEAANPAHKAQLYGASQVQFQGRLVGIVRRYDR